MIDMKGGAFCKEAKRTRNPVEESFLKSQGKKETVPPPHVKKQEKKSALNH